jgi:hypothetical protein
VVYCKYKVKKQKKGREMTLLELDKIAEDYCQSIDKGLGLYAIENYDYRNNTYDYIIGYNVFTEDSDYGEFEKYSWVNLQELGLID